MMKTKIAIILLSGAILTGCSKQGWGVEGTVDNAPDGAKIAVEGFNAGMWYNIDSVEIRTDGHFSYISPEGAPYPEIYRVSLDGQSIYFPIDSLEKVTIKANADNFDTDYTVGGWALAEEMMKIDQSIAESIKANGAAGAANDSILKRQLSETINNDENGILGYYIINKTVGDIPLFSPTNRKDLSMIGALANKFVNKYPDDPRTKYLTERFLRARAAMTPGTERVLEANEAGIFEIELYDAKGQKRKLTDVAKEAGVTLLSFTSYQIEGSVPYNVELNRLYEKYADRPLAIYQVSIDADELQWRTAATNLPWNAVWYDGKDNGTLLRIYNVNEIPTTFIIDRNGDLVERVTNHAEIEDAIRRHL